MDQLVRLITSRTGISEEAARQAISTVVEFLKDRLPKPIAAQVEGLLTGSGGDASGLVSGLGGLMGKR